MVKSVRVDDISELSLVPSISVYRGIQWYDYFVCVGVMYSGEYMFVMLLALSVHPHWASWKVSLATVAGLIPTVAKLTFQLARCGYTLRVTSQTSYKLFAWVHNVHQHTQNKNYWLIDNEFAIFGCLHIQSKKYKIQMLLLI
jgi:hypothetical protein